MNVTVDEQQVQWLRHHAAAANTVVTVVGAIDQGTSSTRFVVFSIQGQIVASAQMEHEQIFPQTGWHEHNPIEIWHNCVACMQAVVDGLAQHDVILQAAAAAAAPAANHQQKQKQPHPQKTATVVIQLAAIGITNQRETTICWNRVTGIPYANAIVWDDSRTATIVHDIIAAGGDINRLRAQTGLPVATYFAGTKVKWLVDHVAQLHADLQNPATRGQVCFGTVDSWLVYQLTGSAANHQNDATTTRGRSTTTAPAANTGGLFVTDVTNASRWLFMNLTQQRWDQQLVDTVCAPHHIPIDTALPQICPSSHVYGMCHADCGVPLLAAGTVPVAAILGDQQAALFGQTAFQPGEAKNTYGTGLFLMMNTGTTAVHSSHGLITTVAYQIGMDGPVHYALEGSVSHSGSTIQWLRDQLQIIGTASESETLATTVSDNAGMYFVPAFSGLFAPYWRTDARACLVGMSAFHHKGHVCRAALEATCYQTKEVFDAIVADSGVHLQRLLVDGGGTHNAFLMQFQADIIAVPVIQPAVMETTAMGAAFAAGLATGVWKDLDEISNLWAVAVTYQPRMSETERDVYWQQWKKAVTKSLDWVQEESDDDDDDDEFVDALTHPSESWDAPDSFFTRKYRATSMLLVAGAALGLGYLLGSARTSRR